MPKFFLSCLLLAVVAGCASPVQQAKESLEGQLTWRDTVDYRDVKTFPGNVVCGEYSPRDKDGNALKFRRFVAVDGKSSNHPSDKDWMVYCSEDSAASLLQHYGIGPVDKSNASLNRVRADLVAMGAALDRYRADGNPRYPLALQDLVPAYLDAVPVDPWGRPYQYDTGSLGFGAAGPYSLKTLGADGEPGGSGEDGDVAAADLVYIDHILAL